MKGRIHGKIAHWCPLLCLDQWLNRTCVLFLTICSSCSHTHAPIASTHALATWGRLKYDNQCQHTNYNMNINFPRPCHSWSLQLPPPSPFLGSWVIPDVMGAKPQLQMGLSGSKQQFKLSNLLLQWENCDHSSISSPSSQAFSIITFCSFPVLSENCLPYWSMLLPLLAPLHFFLRHCSTDYPLPLLKRREIIQAVKVPL